MASSTLRVFVPLTKIDIENRLVYGRATAEEPDLSGEVCDYATTKPFYEKWSADFAKASNGKSLGNLRSMHGKTAAGKVTSIAFNDDEKSIDICAKVVDDVEWNKVVEGVYTGFSQGGRYAKRWVDAKSGLTRYTAEPTEVSLVDLPCLPSATFEVLKAEGVVEKRAFTSVVEEPSHEAIEAEAKALATGTGKPWHEFAEQAATKLLKALTDAALAPLKDVEIETDTSLPVVSVFVEPVQKWDCGCADHTHAVKHEAVKCMKKRATEALVAEAAAPADAALAKLEAELAHALAPTPEGVAEEAVKKISDPEPDLEKAADQVEKTQSEAGIQAVERAVAELQTLVKAGARNSGADQNRLQKCHDLLCELGADCQADDADGDSDVDKIRDENASLRKSVEDFGTRLAAMADKVAELGKRAAPAKAAIMAVEKSQDAVPAKSAAVEEFLKALPEKERVHLLTKLSLSSPISLTTR